MATIMFYALSEEDRITAARNALIAQSRLAAGEALDSLNDDLLLSYICMRQLDLVIAMAESVRRREGIQEQADDPPAYLN